MSTEMKMLNGVKKSCGTASKVLSVISTLVTVGMVLAFVGAGLCFFFRGSIDQAMANSPEIAENIVSSITLFGVNLAYKGNGAYGMQYSITCLTAGLALVFLKVALIFIRRIFYVILNSESPFSAHVIATLKKSFILITIFVAVSTGIVLAAILGIFLWCIYTIFQYGSELQRQADETL